MDNTRKAYNRRTIRLQNYDYAQPGFYYVTICTYKKKWMLGEIVNDEMDLNDVGKVIQLTWNTLPERFPYVELDEYVIMPNHIHGIIIIEGTSINTPRVPNSSKGPERFKQYIHANAAIIPASAPPPYPVGRDKSGPYAPLMRSIIICFSALLLLHYRASILPRRCRGARFGRGIRRGQTRLQGRPVLHLPCLHP